MIIMIEERASGNRNRTPVVLCAKEGNYISKRKSSISFSKLVPSIVLQLLGFFQSSSALQTSNTPKAYAFTNNSFSILKESPTSYPPDVFVYPLNPYFFNASVQPLATALYTCSCYSFHLVCVNYEFNEWLLFFLINRINSTYIAHKNISGILVLARNI